MQAFNATGPYKVEDVESLYNEALRQGHTHDDMMASFRAYLETERGRGKRRGWVGLYSKLLLQDYMRNPAKYPHGPQNPKPTPTTTTSRDSAGESIGPKARPGYTTSQQAMPDVYYDVVGAIGYSEGKALAKAESERSGIDYYECYRRLCAEAMARETDLSSPEFSRVVEDMRQPDYQPLDWSWKRMAGLLKTDEWMRRVTDWDDEWARRQDEEDEEEEEAAE